MAFDIYTPTRIAGVIKNKPPVTTFLKKTFFSETKDFATENVNFDVVDGARSVAPMVNPKIGGKVITDKGYKTMTYTAPLTAPEKVVTADEMMNRMPGEQISSNIKPAERAVKKLAEDLNELDEMITRREEVMCSEVLFTGKVTVKGVGVNEVIDYGFTNKESLTSTKKWSASGSDPLADMERWQRSISKDGHVKANICIMSWDVAQVFIRNESVQKMLDIRNYNIAAIAPTEIKEGVNFVGTIPSLGLSIYTYDEYYDDDWSEEGKVTTKPFVPAGTLALISTHARFTMLYGAINRFDEKTQAPYTFMGTRFGESFLENNNTVRKLRLSSRPLAVPHQLKSWFVATVL